MYPAASDQESKYKHELTRNKEHQGRTEGYPDTNYTRTISISVTFAAKFTVETRGPATVFESEIFVALVVYNLPERSAAANKLIQRKKRLTIVV